MINPLKAATAMHYFCHGGKAMMMIKL